MDEAIKLYEFDYQKPELEDAVIHYGIKGMHWGVRKDSVPHGSGRGRKKKTMGSKVRAAKKQRVGKNKSSQGQKDIRKVTREDLEEVSRNREKYSTNEINDILNRVNTEQRLDDVLNKQSTQSKSKVKQILSDPEFKKVATVALISLPFIVYGVKQYRYNKSKVPGPMDFNNNVPKFIMTDMPKPQPPNAQKYTESLLRLLLGVKVPK